jgi:hypothetical protein
MIEIVYGTENLKIIMTIMIRPVSMIWAFNYEDG